MHIQDLAWEYQSKSDDELLRLATELDQLTSDARAALASELARRKIDGAENLKSFEDAEEPIRHAAEWPSTPKIFSVLQHWEVSEFIGDVLRVYRRHFWFFVKLVAPAVVLGYIAVFGTREIARQFSSDFSLRTNRADLFEIWLVHRCGYLISWLALCVSSGAIAAAVAQIRNGVPPSVRDSIAKVRKRLGPLFRLSLLLFFLALAAEAAADLLSTGSFWILRHRQFYLDAFTLFALAYGAGYLALLVFSRFGLAIPALVLDNFKVGQSVFRSDELTQGKWLILAALLAKSLGAGYVAGMCPYWLAPWITSEVPSFLFPWVSYAASIAGVAVVAPTLFVGLALLYIRTSTKASTLNGNTRTYPQMAASASPSS